MPLTPLNKAISCSSQILSICLYGVFLSIILSVYLNLQKM